MSMNIASIKNVTQRRIALSAWLVGTAVVMAVIFPVGSVLAIIAAFIDAVRDAFWMVSRHWRSYVGTVRDALALWRA